MGIQILLFVPSAIKRNRLTFTCVWMWGGRHQSSSWKECVTVRVVIIFRPCVSSLGSTHITLLYIVCFLFFLIKKWHFFIGSFYMAQQTLFHVIPVCCGAVVGKHCSNASPFSFGVWPWNREVASLKKEKLQILANRHHWLKCTAGRGDAVGWTQNPVTSSSSSALCKQPASAESTAIKPSRWEIWKQCQDWEATWS